MRSPDLEHAVILAGGLGTRLAPITVKIPKPLVPVKGKPFLEHQLNLLRKHGITDVVLLTGFLGQQIEEAFGDGSGLNMRIKYSQEPSQLGTGGALATARELLPEIFFLVNGDTYLDIDYQAAYRGFLNLRPPGVAGMMTVFEQGGPNEDPGNVRLDPTGTRVISYSKGHGGDHYHVDAGVLILMKEVVDWIAPGQPAASEECIYPRLAREGRLLAFSSAAPFYDIGTPDRLASFERSLS